MFEAAMKLGCRLLFVLGCCPSDDDGGRNGGVAAEKGMPDLDVPPPAAKRLCALVLLPVTLAISIGGVADCVDVFLGSDEG
jgi:hypothetical protein